MSGPPKRLKQEIDRNNSVNDFPIVTLQNLPNDIVKNIARNLTSEEILNVYLSMHLNESSSELSTSELSTSELSRFKDFFNKFTFEELLEMYNNDERFRYSPLQDPVIHLLSQKFEEKEKTHPSHFHVSDVIHVKKPFTVAHTWLRRPHDIAPDNTLLLTFKYIKKKLLRVPNSQKIYEVPEEEKFIQCLYYFERGVYRLFEEVRIDSHDVLIQEELYKYIPKEEVYITFNESFNKKINRNNKLLSRLVHKKLRDFPGDIQLVPSPPPPSI